jgi:hypothetical protein
VKLYKKTYLKNLFLIVTFFLSIFLFYNSFLIDARAQEEPGSSAVPTFRFFPPGGTVLNKDQGFVVDILIDTAGQEVVSAKFTVLFDPKVLQVKKAERNNSLFSQFPSDESSIDNENGLILLSGFTQSGTGNLYATGEKPDVFARVTFEVLQEAQTSLDWEFSDDPIFNTGMYRDGSPPQNILTSKPREATFTIGDPILDPSALQTGFTTDKYILATGAVLVLFGAFMVFTKPRGFKKRSGTVVIYDEE